MSDISCTMGTCSYKPSRLAQWAHLFSMNFNDFQSFLLCFSLKCPFPMIKSSPSRNTIYMGLLSITGFDAIQPGLNCFISVIICRIDLQVSALSVTAHTLFPFPEQDRLVANFITEACAVKRELIGNRTCDVHVTPAKLEIPMVPCNFIPVQPRLYKGKGSCHGIRILHCLFEGS